MSVILIIFGLLASPIAWSYPEFIGYKYTTCLTCHYNGHGNGALNDYGRALWSAEIAGRLLSGKKSEEQLSESSGFLGSVQMPWWIRPGIKARELHYKINPGSKDSVDRKILMQAEMNLALFFDEDQKYAFVFSYGHQPNPTEDPEVKDTISREHYFRWQAKPDLWMYFGLLDKVYGIRTSNHTAYSRSRTGLDQDDQSHGVIAHYIQPEWEATLNAFVGNLSKDEEPEVRQKGFSVLYEKEIQQYWRLGTSFLTSESQAKTQNSRIGVFSRSALSLGSSILFELGLINNKLPDVELQSGYYSYTQITHRMSRGYHFLMVGQTYKSQTDAQTVDNVKTGIGLLAFPMARTELRIDLENTKSLSNTPSKVSRDNWAMLAQWHLSL